MSYAPVYFPESNLQIFGKLMQTWIQILEFQILLSFNFSMTNQSSKAALLSPGASCEIQDKLVPSSLIYTDID